MHVKILLKRFYLDDGHPTRFCSLAQKLRLLWCMIWVFILESCNQYYTMCKTDGQTQLAFGLVYIHEMTFFS